MFLTMFLLIFGLYLIYGENAIRMVKRIMKNLTEGNLVVGSLILGSFQFLFAFVLFLPGLSTFNIMQAFFLKSFWRSFLISFGGCYLGSLAVCLVTKIFCRTRVHDKMKEMIIYRMLIKETKLKPYRSGIMFNFLFVPVSVKNYLIGISELSFTHCLVIFIPGHSLLSALCAIIGSTVNDVSELFKSKGYSQKSRIEKIEFLFSILLLAFTLGFFLTLFLVIKKKYKQFLEEENSDAKSVQTKSRNEYVDDS